MLRDLVAAATAGALLSSLLGDVPLPLEQATLLGSNLDTLVACFVAIAVAVAIGIPGTIITASLTSGAVFGLWVGTGLVALSALLGSIVSFAVTRKLARNWVSLRFPRHLDRVQAGFARGGVWYLLAARLLGIPFIAVNLGFALTTIKYPAFMLGSLLGSLPIIAAYSGAGASLAFPSAAMLSAIAVGALVLLLLRHLAEAWLEPRSTKLVKATRKRPSTAP